MCNAQTDVRFTPNSDRKSGHAQIVMSALPPKADMCGATSNVGYGPIADILNASLMEYPCGATLGGAQSLFDFSFVWSKE